MESDDDEFGDFGGFEAAEVVGTKVAQPLPESIAAAASPWAFIPSVEGDDSVQTEAAQTLAVASEAGDEAAVTDGVKDVDLDETSPAQVAWACWPVGDDSKQTTASAIPSSASEIVTDENIVTDVAEVAESHQNEEDTHKTQEQLEKAKEKEEQLASKLEAVKEDKAELTEKLDSLTKLLHASQERVEEVEQQLTKEKENYQQLQTQHEEQLEALKKAGHDALTIIVEEYKQVCQTALREQQVAFEIQIKDVAKQQLEAWNSSIQSQNDEFKEKMSGEREKLTEFVTDTMNKLQEENKVKLDAAMADERERSVLAVDSALQSERSASKVAIEEALHEQRNKSNAALKQHQEQLIVTMDDERNTNQKKVDAAMEKHMEYIQEHMSKVVREERLRSDELLKKAVTAMEEDVRQSMKKEAKAEAAVRHRSLAAIDLFLDSAKEQLRVLLDNKSTEGLS